MSVVDPYVILQLPRNADEVQIKKSYRALALKYHPDKNMYNEEFFTKMFQQIQIAYSILIDPIERKLYEDRESDDEIINNYEDMGNEWRFYKRTHNHYHQNHRKFNYHQKPDPHNPFKYEKKISLYNKLNTTWFDGYSDKPYGFYTLCRKIFEILTLELYEPDPDVTAFGDSTSEFSPTVYKFYRYWNNFYIKVPDGEDDYDAGCRSMEVQVFVEYIESIDERVKKEYELQRLKKKRFDESRVVKGVLKSRSSRPSSRPPPKLYKYKGSASDILEDLDEYGSE